ncbi:MAG: molybdate ABC transporter substrate-binding protein [bacterium]|jgi:molybdate transport system substrate-binding protein
MTGIPAFFALRLFAIFLAIATVAQLSACNRPGGNDAGSDSEKNPAGQKKLAVMASDVFREPLLKAADLYRESTGVDVQVVLGKTGEIEKRAAAGGPCDLLLVADTGALDLLSAAGATGATGAVPLVRERIAVAVRRRDGGGKFLEAQNAVEFLKGAKKVAAASPEYAPSGRLSKKALEYYGLAKSLGGRLVELPSDETVLAYVKNGEADAGMVFSAPALADEGIAIVDFLPYEATGGAYYHALSLPSENREAAAFAEFLRTEKCRAIFMLAGFEVPPPAGNKKQDGKSGARRDDASA